MSKRVNAKYKISRRLGANLWGRSNDPYEVRNYGPGQHGQSGVKGPRSDFGKQLVAKQQLKKYYGNITEKQFRKIYQEAIRQKGDTSENLVALLESRLDSFVYRANFVPSVFAARQLVSHKHVTVNGEKVNIPSYRLKEGDVVEVREKSKQINMVLEATQKLEREVPDYIELDQKAIKAKFIRKPKFADVPYPVVMEPSLVIEFYSR